MSKRYGFWSFRAPVPLRQMMDTAAAEKVKQGKAKKTPSYYRLGLAIARHPGILNDLINSDFKEDK